MGSFSKKLGAIAGAGPQGRVALDILRLTHSDMEWVFIDPQIQQGIVAGAKVLKSFEDLTEKVALVHVAIGNPIWRQKVSTKIREQGYSFVSAIHPTASISPSAKLGVGNFICAAAVINTNAQVGNFTLINTACVIEHDARIGDYSTLCPRSCIGATCIVEEGGFVGSGAIIRTGCAIGSYSVVGMGSVVTKSVPKGALFYGAPAKERGRAGMDYDWSRALSS